MGADKWKLRLVLIFSWISPFLTSFWGVMRTIEASVKSFVHVLMDSFPPFSLEFESNSLYSCNRELCTRANAMAGVVQPSCHSCHKLYFPFTHVDVFLTTSAILHFFYRIPIKNLIHLLSNHSQLPSSLPTKLPLLPPSSKLIWFYHRVQMNCHLHVFLPINHVPDLLHRKECFLP